MQAAHDRLNAGQQAFDLDLGLGSGAAEQGMEPALGPAVVTGTRSEVLWEVLTGAPTPRGSALAEGAFRAMVLARLVDGLEGGGGRDPRGPRGERPATSQSTREELAATVGCPVTGGPPVTPSRSNALRALDLRLRHLQECCKCGLVVRRADVFHDRAHPGPPKRSGPPSRARPS